MIIKEIENNIKKEPNIKTINNIKQTNLRNSLLIKKNSNNDKIKENPDTIKIKNSTHLES